MIDKSLVHCQVVTKLYLKVINKFNFILRKNYEIIKLNKFIANASRLPRNYSQSTPGADLMILY